MYGLGGQCRIDHRIVDCILGTGSLRSFGIASVGIGRSSGSSLLRTGFFRSYGHTSQLGLGRFLVAFSEAFVALPLGIINHPVASLAGIGDGPWDLAECFVQGQVVANRTLKRIRDVSIPIVN